MSDRDDNQFCENVGIMFVIYCDTNGLSREEGHYLADTLAETLASRADERSYVE